MVIEVFAEYANIRKATHSTGNGYVRSLRGIEDVVDGFARILAVSYFGYHSAFLF